MGRMQTSNSLRIGSLALFVAAMGTSAFGQTPELFPGSVVDVPFPIAFKAVDVNGDGNLDLLGLSTLEQLYVCLNQGGGAMSAAVGYAAGPSPQSLALGDWDADNDIDVFVALRYAGSVVVLRNNGAGVFTAAGSFPAVADAVYVRAGDLNGDSFPDLVALGMFSNNVCVLLATGPASFAAPVPYPSGGHPVSVRIADLDGDGVQDLAVGNSNLVSISTMRGLGNGTFAPPANLGTASSRSNEVLDLDGDGDLDLAAVNGLNLLSIFWNSGNGTYSSPLFISVPQGTGSLCKADLDGDFRQELVVTGAYDDSTQVLRYVGGGSPVAKSDVYLGHLMGECAIGDVDGDGHLDLAGSNNDLNALAWFRGHGDATFGASNRVWTPNVEEHVVGGDFTGDGILDFAAQSLHQVSLARGLGNGKYAPPVLAHASNYLPESLAAGDLDGDLDLDLVVAMDVTWYGPGPLTLLFNNGAGSFTPIFPYAPPIPTPIYPPYSPWSAVDVALGDIDGDGDLDIVSGKNGVFVHVNQGAGVFAQLVAYPVGMSVRALALADVDGDLDLDVLAASAGSLAVLINDGSGAFPNLNTIQGAGIYAFDIAVGDIDQDGDLDAVVAAGDYALYQNIGNGTFLPSAVLEPRGVGACRIADIDADGVVDLIGCVGLGTISVLASTGGGTFGTPRTFMTAGTPPDFQLADLDQDQDLDVATTYGVVFNQLIELPRPYCHGKLNSQGCTPTIGSNGVPSASSPSAFTISASNVVNQKPGLLLYSLHASAQPLLGGTLCLGVPVRRTAPQNSGGTPPPTANCTGTFAFDFNQLIQSGTNPALVPGATVFCQYWARDTLAFQSASSSNALEFRIRP